MAIACEGSLDEGVRLWHEALSPRLVVPHRPRDPHQIHGRDAELRQCATFLAAARARGEAAAVLVVAEKGGGKTTFVDHLAMAASAEGFDVAWAAEDRSGISALEAAIGLTFDVGEGIRLSLGDAAMEQLEEIRTARLSDELAARSNRRPYVIVVENLHDASASMFLVVRRLACVAAPVVLVCTTRPVDAGHPNEQHITLLSEKAAVLPLPRLDLQATLRMAGEWARALPASLRRALGEKVFDLAGGHPRQTRALLERHLAPEGDWRLGSDLLAVERDGRLTAIELEKDKLTALPPETGRALQAAAVLGVTFDLTMLRHVANAAKLEAALSTSLLPAVERGVVRPVDAATYAFTHEAVWEAARALTSPLMSRDLNVAAAEGLRSAEGRRWVPDPMTHARATLRHLRDARPESSAMTHALVAWALRTIDLAIETFDLEVAAMALKTAMAVLPENESEHPAVRTALSRVSAMLPAARTRRAAIEESMGLLRVGKVRDPDLLADLANSLAFQGIFARPDPGILDLCLAALDEIPADRLDLRSRIEGALSFLLVWTGQRHLPDGTPVEALNDRALSNALAADDGRALFAAREARNSILATISGAEKLLENAMAIREPTGAFNSALLTAHLRLGNRRDFDRALESFRDERNARNPLWHRAMCAQFDALVAFMAGDLKRAAIHVDVVGSVARGADDDNFALLHFGETMWLHYERNDLAGFRQATGLEDGLLTGMIVAFALFQACPGGDRGAAQAIVDRLLAHGLENVPRDMTWTAVLALMAETAAFLRDRGAATALFNELRAFSGEMVVVANGFLCFGAADRYLGTLADLAGLPFDVVEQYFDQAEALEHTLAAPALEARTRYWYARSLASHGRSADALLVLEEALADLPEQLVALRSWMRSLQRRLQRKGDTE